MREATGAESFSDLVDELGDDPARTGAEAMIRMNPELDLIGTDDAARTITFRNSRTGEQATLNFADIAEGRFNMTTGEGEYSVDASAETVVGGEGGVTFRGPEGETRIGTAAGRVDLPGWVPIYPGGNEPQTSHQTETSSGLSAAVSSTTSVDAQMVVDHYKKTFEDTGYSIGSESITKTGDAVFGAITGERQEEQRSINVAVIQSAGKTQVVVNFTGKQ